MKRYRWMYFASLAVWLVLIIWCLAIPVQSDYEAAPVEIESAEEMAADFVLANSDVNAEAQEPVTYEDWFRANASVIEDCIITHYCCEKYEHICGTGDGITATGVPVTAGWTCAVDPSVIPYGCEVMVDYGDSVAFYKAQDRGPAIDGNHIDLAVETHAEALQIGTRMATVYFMEVENEFG